MQRFSSHRPWATTSLLLLIALCVGAWDPSAFGQASKPKGPKARRTLLTVLTNVPAAQITSDGLLRGKSGQPFEVDPGLVEVSLTANGYVKRSFFFQVTDGKDLKVKINLIRQFKAAKTRVVALKEPEDVDSVLNEESLCVRLEASLPQKGDGSSRCKLRRNWSEDLRFAGIEEQAYAAPSIFFQAAQKTQFTALQTQFLTSIPDSNWLASADYLRAEVPDYVPVSALEAWGYLANGHCQRLGLIWNDAMQHGSGEPTVLAVQEALCRELAGERPRAMEGLRKLVNQKGVPPPKIPYFYYHLARMEMLEWMNGASSQTQIERKRSISNFEPFLVTCLRTFPRYYPCLDLYRFSLLAQDRQEDLKNTYLALLQMTSLEPLKLLEANWKGMYTPRDYQLLWDALRQDFADNRDVQLASYVVEKREGRAIQVEQAINAVEGAKFGDYPMTVKLTQEILSRGEVALATRIFQFLLHEDTKRDNVRWHLISIARGRKDFKTCVSLGQEVPLSFTNPIVSSFRKLQGDCLLRLKRYKEAAELFDTMLQDAHADWTVGYHAALAYDKLRDALKTSDALTQSLQRNPPAAFKEKIQKMLEKINAAKTDQ